MFKKILTCIILGSLVFLSIKVKATDYSSADFTVKDSVIVPGTGFATSNSYQLWSSFGQPGIGLSNTTDFGLRAGFLYFPLPTKVTTTTPPPSVLSGPGGYAFAGVSPVLISVKKPATVAICDFNGDSECAIDDFSILLYYYGQSGPKIAKYDLGHFGVIDLRDVSILFYYWTET